MSIVGFSPFRMRGANDRRTSANGRCESNVDLCVSPRTENHLTQRKESRYHAHKFSLI